MDGYPGKGAQQRQWFAKAKRLAASIGLSPEDAEDYAITFERRLLDPKDPLFHAEAGGVHRSAFSSSKTALLRRSIKRREAREWPLLSLLQATHQEVADADAPDPVDLLLRKELIEDFRRALAKLTPTQRWMLTCYHQDEQNIPMIAKECGKSSHAVQECLSNARQRIRVLMERAGWTAAEVRTLLGSIGRR